MEHFPPYIYGIKQQSDSLHFMRVCDVYVLIWGVVGHYYRVETGELTLLRHHISLG